MPRFPIIPGWTQTVGRLLAEGAVVHAHCSGCGVTHHPGLEKLQARFGPLYSLWNRHPSCPTRCRGKLTFAALRPDAAMWPTLMRTDDPRQTDELHRIWRADREAARAEEADRAWLLKRLRRRRDVRARARKLVERLGPGALAAAEDTLHLPRQSAYQLADNIDVYREVMRQAARAAARAAAVDDLDAGAMV